MLRSFIARSESVDVAGSILRAEETARKIFEAFSEHEAEDKVRHAELRGDYKGLSLRVGAIEKVHEKLERDHEKLEDQLENTGRIEIVTLKEKVQWRDRGFFGAIGAIFLLVLGALLSWFFKSKGLK